MTSPPRSERFAFVVIASLGALVVAICSPRYAGVFEYPAVGLIIGTLFSHATLAAAWTVLGPWPLKIRLPCSLAWLAVISVGLSLNFLTSRGAPEIIVVIFGCLVGQWLLTQVPLWALAIGYGVRLRKAGDMVESERSDRQFGIRQLIVITAIVGCVLGIGRAVVLSLAPRFRSGFGGEDIIFVYLAVVGVWLTIPLLLAALLERSGPVAVIAVIALIAMFTALELPLMQAVSSARGPDIWHVGLINTFQVVWILSIAALLRQGGYLLLQTTRRSA
jgi:hypothetical protein